MVLEAKSREYVESRVRAGVLEQGTVDLMAELGVDARLRRESMIDDALDIRFSRQADPPRPARPARGGKLVHIYGQQEVVKDLIAANLAHGVPILFEAEATGLDGLTGEKPTIRFKHDGKDETLACDIVAGCDGFHGICRAAIPADLLKTYDRVFPYGWLGILSESPPLPDMTYANHDRGFALASRRSPHMSRLYVQCSLDDDVANWSDAQLWDELHIRLDDAARTEIKEGRILQRGITPCRSFVSAPMRYGRMFLAGDACHIVPPTGAKGLNLAVADVRVLSRALIEFFSGRAGSPGALFRHLPQARLEGGALFHLHDDRCCTAPPDQTPFDRQIQLAELEYVLGSHAAQTTIAENYVGLPFEED